MSRGIKARLGLRGRVRMLFIMGLVLGALLMILARRRAGAIRLRIQCGSRDQRIASWAGAARQDPA